MYATYEEPSERTKITVVQPNIDPYHEKFVLKQSEQNELLIGLMDQAPQDADLIVAPETAIDEYFWEEYLERTPSMLLFHDFIRQRKPGTMVVTGANTYVPYDSEETASPTARERGGQWYDVFNTALGLDSTEAIKIHHKGKLVIGAEMLPYYSVIRKWKFLFVDLGGLSGTDRIRESARGVYRSGRRPCRAGDLLRGGLRRIFHRVRSQRGAGDVRDFERRLVADTPGHRYLFAYSRLRAVENRRSIARSANTGISGFIDQRGDVLQKLGWDQRGALTDSLSLNDRMTFYTRYGDVIGRVSSYVFVLGLLYFMAYRFRRKSHIVD